MTQMTELRQVVTDGLKGMYSKTNSLQFDVDKVLSKKQRLKKEKISINVLMYYCCAGLTQFLRMYH